MAKVSAILYKRAEGGLSGQVHIVRYAPVAQLDSACDSDVSGRSSCDKVQSPANRGVERAERKNLGSVDYCLTTKFPDGREALQLHIARYAPVAQLDSACDSDSQGRWFESSRAYQNPSEFNISGGFCFN